MDLEPEIEQLEVNVQKTLSDENIAFWCAHSVFKQFSYAHTHLTCYSVLFVSKIHMHYSCYPRAVAWSTLKEIMVY